MNNPVPQHKDSLREVEIAIAIQVEHIEKFSCFESNRSFGAHDHQRQHLRDGVLPA